MTSHPLSTIGVLSALVLLLAGCASTEPRPESSLGVAQAAITEAESAGARETSPELLKQARDKVDDARQLIDKENHTEARRALEQATADARLAEARADTARDRQAVEQLNATIEKLRERMMEGQS